MASPKQASNKTKQAKHDRSWAKAQEKKAFNIADNEKKRKANDIFRKAGKQTPYQDRKLAKFLERIAAKYGQHDETSVE